MITVWHVLSFLGSSVFYAPVLLVGYWCVSPRGAARLLVVLGLSGVLNTLLKLVFHAPRPYWTDRGLKVYEGQASFGMPSGHAQSAVVVWGMLAASLARRWLWAVAALLALLIGLSRIYLHVHSPGQVLAGWAVGAVLLVAVITLEPIVVPWWTARPLAVQFALSLAAALAWLALTELAVRHLHGWRMPADWASAIEQSGKVVRPVGRYDGEAGSGVLFGGLAGLSLLARLGWFEAGGVAPWRRWTRVPIAVAGLGVLYPLTRIGVLTFAAEALLAFWAAAGAPLVFRRMGLANRGTPQVTRPGEIAAPGPS